MIVCHSCWDLHDRSEFYRNPKMASGYLRQCKSCVRVRKTVYRQTNRLQIRARQRAWEQKPESKAKAHVRISAWKQQHPLRRSAQVAVNNAVRDGRLLRQPCWVCGEYAHAHHPDYAQPLDVVWLCPVHHRQAHEAAK